MICLGQKLGRKLSWVHKTPNWPSWAHRRAQARACLAVLWALRPCRGLAAQSCRGLHGRIAACTRAVSCALALCRSAPAVVSQRPSGRIAAPQRPCRRPCCAPLAGGLGSAKFLHHFFFFVFHYKYFFSLFPAAKRITKIIFFFFHFLGHSNKFIKIYFTPFSSISHLVKS